MAGLLALAAGSAQAQQAGTDRDLNDDWIGLNLATGHVQKSLAAFVAEAHADRARAADLESRLKWVLDHWVGAPPAVLPNDGKP